MPMYFLNLRRSGELTEDLEGYDLPDLEAVREEAVEGARTIVSEDVRFGKEINLADSVEITDSDGKHLQTITFADAISWFKG